MSNVVIRPAVMSDLSAIVNIYNHYIEHTPITFDLHPCTTESRKEWFEQFQETGPYRLLVADIDDRIYGYACCFKHRIRPAYDSTVETSIYVDHENTHGGVGTKLYQNLFDILTKDENIHRAVAGTTIPNEASISFHRKFGFQKIGIFTEIGYKFDRYWDVLWSEKHL